MFAAMDTTSSALARILHLLALHQDVQDKLRVELRDAYENFGAQPDHDVLVSLPYLDAVCRETLRLCVHYDFRGDCMLTLLTRSGIPQFLPSPESAFSLLHLQPFA